jgi:DNA-binding NarL/FixJ family response regulator
MRILIADDNQFVRRGIAELLSKQTGWEISGQSADGPETLRMARELHPDLILLDIRIPGVRGFDLARQIRREFPKIRLFLMSQHDPEQILPVALEVGAEGCIDKIRIAQDLVAAIKAHTK